MRLIDATKIKYTNLWEGSGDYYYIAHLTDIFEMPTIEAIPIKWLKEYQAKNGGRVTLQRALKDWRKENE